MLSPVVKRIQRLTRVNALLIAILHFNAEHESLNPTSLKYRRGNIQLSRKEKRVVHDALQKDLHCFPFHE